VLDRVIDTSDFKSSHQEAWCSQKLAAFGGASLRYRIMRDTCAPFHVHEHCPECFFVLSGVVHIDTETGTVSLGLGSFLPCNLASGTAPASRAKPQCWCLMACRTKHARAARAFKVARQRVSPSLRRRPHRAFNTDTQPGRPL
jgi:hypothetical protein